MPSLDVRSPWCKVFTRQLYLVILDMQAPIRILESIYGKPFFSKIPSVYNFMKFIQLKESYKIIDSRNLIEQT